ncbi:MAG: peptide chain release factor N(5)-glutamine methyltransferase [Parvibaculaceae bacterium]
MTPKRVADARRDLSRELAEAGIPSPALDARVLLMLASGLSHERLAVEPERLLQPEEIQRLAAFAARRLAGEPVSRIRGEREFFGLPFSIDASTLDPRPDTEILVELALAFAKSRERRRLRILDLGTGSGAILVSLLAALPDAEGVGTDASVAALAMAERNAARNGVAGRAAFRKADWCDGIEGAFDLIVSNPPYIPAGEIAGLATEVSRFDPRSALDGGADGLAPYRAIAAGAAQLLVPGGLLVVEIGAGQEPEVVAILANFGWKASGFASRRTDLAGHVRALGFERL